VAAGEVLFDVAAMADYGKLSGRKLDEQQAGARIAVEAHKKNPADFVLWKLSSADEPGWESPWGRGRPGWHIECSVMSQKSLGEVFDIHGGGLDLIFPHHENEIAQSRCAHGTKVMANYWMHNGFLQVEGQKMSKSLGNFTTIADVLKEWPGEVARFNMLRTHYRQPIDWTRSALDESQRILEKLFSRVKKFDMKTMGIEVDESYPKNEKLDASLIEALADDLNFPAYLAKLHDIHFDAVVDAGLLLVGLDWRKYARTKGSEEIDREQIVRLVEDRLLARHNKDWKESDRIRDELAGMGIAIKDHKDGTTTWEVKR
jgi:cysteinyl-tRNA synthetase